jgi:hypothetical protein
MAKATNKATSTYIPAQKIVHLFFSAAVFAACQKFCEDASFERLPDSLRPRALATVSPARNMVVSRSQTTTQIFKNDSRFLFVGIWLPRKSRESEEGEASNGMW